jgi:hypothetical protein
MESAMTTRFQQNTPTNGEYLWSTTANWVGGVVPGDGAAVVFDVSGFNNPSGYDDITSLALDSLDVVNGFAAVGASLIIGTVSFGSTVASVFSDTDLGAAAATLTIDGFSGATDGRVGAFGANALTNVLSATDPGEIYQVDEGGELVLSATPHGNPGPVNAGFYYQNSHGVGELPSGTFAFRNPGATVTSLLSNAAIGDSIALPGGDVVSVTYGTNSLSVVTNLGTTTFSDVAYLAGATPTAFVAAADPVTGLERVTFASQQTDSFQQNTPTSGEYLWSTTANWVGGALPGDGAAVTFDVSGSNNPSGYDDIASLALDSLNVVNGFAAVGASLSIGTVSFGSTVASVFSDTDLGAAAATLTIDGFSGATDGRVGAFGANAHTNVLGTTDPGEIYQVDEGGELVLSATPHGSPGPVNAGFYYQNSHGTGELPSGTFAFQNPGGTVTSLLSNVAVGDSIALPGSDVVSVTYGTNSLTVVTNLGTTTFSDVTYLAGSAPTGYVAATDPITGLERVTFSSQQTDSFQQNTPTSGEYLWSTTANWVGAVVPGDGAAVTFDVNGSNNPSGYDDIANLALDSLDVVNGFAAVGASLSIGTVRFGSTVASVFTDTDLGATAATLTIDGFGGATDGRVGAFGVNALTYVLGVTDPGEIYQVDEGGELVLSATPHGNPGPVNAGFYYQNSHGTGELPSGTFAFRNPGGTVSSLLSNVAIGDSIALPGSDVASVTYGTNSLSVVTNLGTTTFSDVTYLAGATPTAFVAATDPVTGLERVTFASQQTDSFQLVTPTSGEYLWSTTANWVGGVVPGDGAAVTFDVSGSNNPSGYDDIASLALDSLDVVNGFAAVGASLSVGTVSFGSTVASVFSDTDLGSQAATLTVGGFSGATDGRVGAFGSNALSNILSATDPGEIYQVDEGGELVLSATPHGNPGPVNAGFYYQNSHGTGELPSGTFAFRNPDGTVSSLLSNVAIGDSIALPGSDVVSVTYGTNSLSVVTNLGTTTFSDATYVSNELFTGFTAATDPASGLERITFTGDQTDSFQRVTPTNGEYLWSTTANWVGGVVPGDGAAVTFDVSGSNNPSGYDDIASLFLDSLDVVNGFAAVGASLSIGTVSFGSTVASVFSDTDLGATAATLTIDGFSGATDGRVGAFGANALTNVQGTTDPGEIYQVDEGGELVLNPTPHGNPGPVNAGFYYQNSHGTGELPSGTFAFRNPGGTVSSLLSNVAIGDSIALPGGDIVAVTYSASSIAIRTTSGTTSFSDVTYLAGSTPTGFAAAADPVSGLERITFTGQTSLTFQQGAASTVGSSSEFVWSNAANWTTNVVPSDGDVVNFGVSGSSPSNPGGYDDIGSLFLGRLTLPTGYLAVGGSLTIATMSAGEAGSRGIEADTLLNGGTADVTINALSFGGAFIGAEGTNAVTTLNAATDPRAIYQAADGGMVVLSPTPNASSQLLLNLGDSASDTGTIALVNPGTTVAGQLGNVGVGDAIELPGTSVTTVTYGPSNLTVVTNVGTTAFSHVSYLSSTLSGSPTPVSFTAARDASTGLEKITFTLCFCKGALIRTPSGDVRVEKLAAGDTVVTWGGTHRPITWIGAGRVLATRGRRNAATPVIVRRGALADNVPNADLRVTKGHSLFIDGVLIPVEFLVNHRSIQWDDRAQEVSVYHVELATHDVLIANGAAAESYRDDGNRWLFQNTNNGWGAEAQVPCAPVLTGGAILDQVWRRLLDRSGPRPGLILTDDPDLHLVVDGRRMDAVRVDGANYMFRHPPGEPFRDVRIVSRAAAPDELGLARDPRVLGIAVRSVTVMAGARYRMIEAADDRLSEGFHGYEPELDFRWTDGSALLPADLFAGFDGAADIVLQVECTTRYLATAERREIAA